MKKTPLKKKKYTLKKTPLISKGNGLAKTSILKNKGSELSKNTELKKQNEKTKEKWEKVRNQILERDNYKCIICGKPATQVHHIHLRSKRKDLLYEFNNLVSLCDKHHDHFGTYGLNKVNNRIAEIKHMTIEELLEFAEIKDGK
jgi:5-methylcytosine-specific restriction endonuclease McrA